MIGREQIEQIIAQYAKHGWKLRRVLLSEALRQKLAGAAEKFDDAEIFPAELDAAWFTRSSRPGITAWELRHLSTAPFALVENITEAIGPDEAEEILKRAETKMMQTVTARKPGNSH